MRYVAVIGLEVHVELKTKSKMFCSCSSDYFGSMPNTHTCPVCLGLPGALPVPNAKAIEWCVMIGHALQCKIPLKAKFDRKNYFYPDLAKGYQISQYEEPFAIQGSLKLESGLIVHIRRVHMEEDTGKLIHSSSKAKEVSYIDFNRSGVPLVEIVTEPDFSTAREVKEYLQTLHQIVQYIGVSNANMEKGEMRLEPNISLRTEGDTILPTYKVEVKNINSFNFVEDAINFEIKRQEALLREGIIPLQETRGWNEDKKKTVSQRSKEEAQDYRYFPEPDIPPIIWREEDISRICDTMPELPSVTFDRFVHTYQLSVYNAEILTREVKSAHYFDKCVIVNTLLIQKKAIHTDAKTIANWIINKRVDINKTMPSDLIKLIISAGQVSGTSSEELKAIIRSIIDANNKPVQDYKQGKENALMFLIGQAMKALKGKERAEKVKEVMIQLLKPDK